MAHDKVHDKGHYALSVWIITRRKVCICGCTKCRSDRVCICETCECRKAFPDVEHVRCPDRIDIGSVPGMTSER